MHQPPVEVARTTSPRGELLLRRRYDGAREVLELRANGVFVMDTAETSSEEALAREAVAVVEHPGHVLVGGLGLGFTLATVLADPRVERCTVVEIEPALVGWLRDGSVPHGPALLADPRVEVRVADVAAELRGADPATLRPRPARRRQRAGLPRPRRQRRALRRALPRLDPPRPATRWSPGHLVGRPRARAARRPRARPTTAPTSSPARSCCRAAGSTTGSTPGDSAPSSLGGVSEEPPTTRTEHDSMGEVEVPSLGALAEPRPSARSTTSRSAAPRSSRALIHALALVKACAAIVNAALGVLDGRAGRGDRGRCRRGRLGRARRPVPGRRLPDRLGHQLQHERQRGDRPLATLGGVEVHPNDHVNAGQSSNDTFPTASTWPPPGAVVEDLHPALATLETQPGGQGGASSPTRSSPAAPT